MTQKLPVCLWPLLLALPVFLGAQTFSATPALAIADDRVIVSYLDISGLPARIDADSFGLESVCLNLSHNEVRHLIISLYAPDGTMVKLTHLNGRENDFQFTCFRDNAKPLQWEKPPYTGAYRPVLPLGAVNNRQNPNGSWRLVVEQFGGPDDSGVLERWSLSFGDHPNAYPVPESSNLPILRIQTGGQYIPDEPKIAAHLSVVDRGKSARNRFDEPDSIAFSGPIGIEWRGASSKFFWQPSYSIETRDSMGADLDVPLLGMPPESDWVLHGPFTDKSLLRNALTFSLASGAIAAYVPRSRFCEVVLDGSYLGVFLLMEKIKRGEQRLAIAKMRKSDVAGDARTGGYILQVDRNNGEGWHSPFRSGIGFDEKKVFFNYVYPKAEDLQPAQLAYIQSYVDSFEQALFRPDEPGAWRQFAEENSFVDFFLFQELCKNVDAYRLSSYLFKPRDSDGGKLHAGPLWDFNLAWRNANYNDNENPAGWTLDGAASGVPFWWRRLLEDSSFTQNLQCRWQDLRNTTLSQRRIFGTIDSLAEVVAEARERHFDLYPILGRGLWPNPKPIAKTYEEEIRNMKTWVSERLTWIDNHLPGLCFSGPDRMEAPRWLIYPNPARQQFRVYFEKLPATGDRVELVDLAGRLVRQWQVANFEEQFELNGLAGGVYALLYRSGDGRVQNRQLVMITL